MPATPPDQPSRPDDPIRSRARPDGGAPGASRDRLRPAGPAGLSGLTNRPSRPTDNPSGPTGPRRPGRGNRPSRPSRPPLAVAVAVATAWAAFLSYLPVALAMILSQVPGGTGSVGGAARTALAGWLLAHGVPLDTSAGPFRLAPLALTLLAAWRVSRAGVHVTRAIGARNSGSPGRALAVAGAVGIGYGGIGALAALAVTGDGIAVAPLRAGLTLALFGALGALLGAVRTTGVSDAVADRIPAVLRDGVRTGGVAALLVLGAGAGAAGLAVAMGGGEASDVIGAYRTGVPGQAGITLVSLGYAPNLAVWAAAYLLGPGFAVGTETTVRTTEVTLGALPAVPLLAGLPNGPVDGLGAALLAVPVLAGMVAGWLLARRVLRAALAERPAAPHSTARSTARSGARSGARDADPPLPWKSLLTAALIGGPVAGALLGLAATASGGALGGGRMAQLGPVGWQIALAATVVVVVGTLVGAAATRAVSPP